MPNVAFWPGLGCWSDTIQSDGIGSVARRIGRDVAEGEPVVVDHGSLATSSVLQT